jgi:hypothetical protein
MTAGMVHVTNLTPPGSDNPTGVRPGLHIRVLGSGGAVGGDYADG